MPLQDQPSRFDSHDVPIVDLLTDHNALNALRAADQCSDPMTVDDGSDESDDRLTGILSQCLAHVFLC